MAQPSNTTPVPDPMPVNLPGHYVVEHRRTFFRVELNHDEEDLIPRRYLEAAEKSNDYRISPWIMHAFRTEKGVIEFAKWSPSDSRFRTTFESLVKNPCLKEGLFAGGYEATGLPTDNRPLDETEARRFARIMRLEQRAIVSFLQDILKGASTAHRTPDGKSKLSLTYRRKRIAYFMNSMSRRRATHTGPETHAFLTVDHHPNERVFSRNVVPITVTDNPHITVPAHFQKCVEILIGQLSYQMRDVSNNIFSLADQEAYLLHLHGSHLQLLRLVAPGFKTSQIRSHAHEGFVNGETHTSLPPNFAEHLAVSFLDDSDGDLRALRTRLERRFIRKVLEQVTWFRLNRGAATEGTIEQALNQDCRVFQVLVSPEYDLWTWEGFRGAVRLVSGLCRYLMSGAARVGAVQKLFWLWPKKVDDGDDYDEGEFDWFWRQNWGMEVDEEEEDETEASLDSADPDPDYENLDDYETELGVELEDDGAAYGSEDDEGIEMSGEQDADTE
ncbi:hypothetical protein BO86DRAFT_398580 [Aspergillus japonicus CBS 114.51]|uniref:Uncharacterized protein n=2 Tax=Aspergillus TaxID=5052 RepID=A0A2V5HIU2_ASPV1|nr:hypothetical protein BO86DRAFT_398580 [Aspergillus japonicus CBS 114.51]PYI24299.1 hypothetical protein BO99DRAFT_427949 [Aspergillus violaceofuscus CBS 115571]RAH82893.1 hypothetical protein BO86DRAFT_398580 [Aspergillus japonicus CBS 114.51]